MNVYYTQRLFDKYFQKIIRFTVWQCANWIMIGVYKIIQNGLLIENVTVKNDIQIFRN